MAKSQACLFPVGSPFVNKGIEDYADKKIVGKIKKWIKGTVDRL